jgi:AbrB family looped-hinge helix DNA binding protein
MPFVDQNGMRLRIDKSGRIVVPQSLRDRLGVTPDSELEVLERADGILLQPAEQKPSLLKIEGLWIHQGSAAPDANWAQVLADLREE